MIRKFKNASNRLKLMKKNGGLRKPNCIGFLLNIRSINLIWKLRKRLSSLSGRNSLKLKGI